MKANQSAGGRCTIAVVVLCASAVALAACGQAGTGDGADKRSAGTRPPVAGQAAVTRAAAPAEPRATGSGQFNNSASLLLDGVLPADETAFDDAQCVHWTDPAANFVVDLGQVRRLDGVTLQVDNNDDYILEISTDGTRYAPYLRVRDSAGQVEWGMQTVSTLADHPAYLPELAVEPVVARYVRVRASGGDNAYGLSEIQLASRPLDAQEAAALDAPPAGAGASGSGPSGQWQQQELEGGVQPATAAAASPEALDEAASAASRGGGSQAAGRLAASAGSAAGPSERPGVTHAGDEDVTLEEAFDAIDTNRDGKLTKREYAAIWKDATDLDRKFAFFDRNRSGFIEKQEYLSLPEAMKRGQVR